MDYGVSWRLQRGRQMAPRDRLQDELPSSSPNFSRQRGPAPGWGPEGWGPPPSLWDSPPSEVAKR